MPQRRAPRTRRAATSVALDRHVLYEAAVQDPETDLPFLRRVARRHLGREPRRMREDFCGTGALSCAFVRKHRENQAWGVDLDEPTLAWGRREHVARLDAAASRVRLLCGDVRGTRTPPADLVVALNFSYSVFHARQELLAWLLATRKRLAPGGVLVMDAFGGEDAMGEDFETRRVTGKRGPDGLPVPAFTYEWEQASFNPLDHRLTCYIHFGLSGGRWLRRAFRYDWRLWTVPELRDLLAEAGFASSEVYVEGWDDEEDEPSGVFRRRTVLENQASWLAYVVGVA